MYSIHSAKEALLPRERLMTYGPESLSNQELLAILLRTGTKKEHVLNLSIKILNGLDSLADFRSLSLEELQEIEGIGQVRSVEIKAMLELSKRINQAEYNFKERILSSERLAKIMMSELGDKRQEHLIAIYLDTQTREILHYACKSMATSLIIVHNHPSGSTYPSENDLRFTEKIKRSCDDLGIVFLDHIIVGKKEYYSFREETDLV